MAKCRVCSRPRLIMHLCSKNKNNSLLLEDLTAGVNHESHQEGAGTSLRTHKTFTKRRVHFQSSEGKSLEEHLLYTHHTQPVVVPQSLPGRQQQEASQPSTDQEARLRYRGEARSISAQSPREHQQLVSLRESI